GSSDLQIKLEPEHRVRRMRADLAGNPVDDADALPPDPNLVALDEAGGVRHLGLDPVGGDERQAGVRVVGEEDRNDRDEHGHSPDQDRRAGEAGGLARAHGFRSQSRSWEGLVGGGPFGRWVRRFASCAARRARLASLFRCAELPPSPAGDLPGAEAKVAGVVCRPELAPAFGAPFPTPLKCAEHPAAGVSAYWLQVPPSW